jgi:hypothetical protein
VIGVANLVNKKKGDFTSEDAEWFETYVAVCYLAILNAFFLEQETKRKFEQNAISQTAMALSLPTEKVLLIKQLLESCRNLVDSQMCAFFLYDEENNVLVRQVCDCYADFNPSDPPTFPASQASCFLAYLHHDACSVLTFLVSRESLVTCSRGGKH